MTTPSTGFPDWQAFTVTQSKNLFSNFSTIFPVGNTDTSVITVANWSSLFIDMQCTVGFGQILIIWTADLAGTQVIATDTLLARNGLVIQVKFPVRGPYVKIRFNNTSGANATVTTWAQMQAGAINALVFPITSVVAIWNNANFITGHTETKDWPVMKPGQAQFSLTPSTTGTLYSADIFAEDETGAVIFHIAEFTNISAGFAQVLVIPARPISIKITNIGTVNSNIDAALIGCPNL